MTNTKKPLRKPGPDRGPANLVSEVAKSFIHHLAPSFRPPARLVTPTEEAELAVIDAVVLEAADRGIPTEIVDLRPAPAELLHQVTERLKEFRQGQDAGDEMPTLLILRGFDVFGDEAQNGPTYPFRAKFQFDRSHLWLFLGRDASRMRWLFGSYARPLYESTVDITPKPWRIPS